jgi:hypothetical protein
MRDHEYCGLEPAQANSTQDLISKKPITKKGLVQWLKVKALSSKPRTAKRKKENLGDMAQVVEFLPFKHEILSLIQ